MNPRQVRERWPIREINYLAVLAAAFLAFLVGTVWYTPLLFAEAWLTLPGVDAAELADATPVPGVILTELVRVLVIAYVAAFALPALPQKG